MKTTSNSTICSLNFYKVKNKRSDYFYLICSFITLLHLAGCSNLILPDFELKPTDQYSIREKSEELELVAQPFKDSEENIRIFGVDILSMGQLPVLLIANNLSADKSYIIRKDNISIVGGNNDIDSQGNLRTQLNKKESELDNTATVTAYISPITSLFASVEKQNMQEIKRNLLENEFQSCTVSPGKNKYGFIYLNLSDYDAHDPLLVSIDFYNIRTRETNNIKVPLGRIEELNRSHEN